MTALRTSLRKLFSSLALAAAVFGGSTGAAHDIDVTGVARVFLDETSAGQYSLSIVDQQVPPLFEITRILPDRCTARDPGPYAYRFACDPVLNLDDELAFPWGLEGVVVIARWQGEPETSGYFPGDGTQVVVPLSELSAASSSLANLAWRYLVLGVDHIIFGIDHLLFVLGMLLLISGPWKLVQTVTAFTVAHSITLAFAVLGIVLVPGAPVEVLIAVSIAFLAREVLVKEQGQQTLSHRFPWVVAFVFGLFHGFGFADALGELGLRDADVPPALLFFNLGVEAGQLGFIAVLLLAGWLGKRLAPTMLPSIERGLAYGLGVIATFWVFERTPILFAA